MPQNKMINSITKHIQENFWLYALSLLCTCIGIVLGIYAVKYMSVSDKNDLINLLSEFSSASATQSVDYKSIFLESLKNNLPIVIGIWFLGLTIVGIPIILILNILKGFTIGFTISFFISALGLKGIWMSILGVLPQNIVYIPCIIFISVIAMEYSLMLIKNKGIKYMNIGTFQGTNRYNILFSIIILIMGIGMIMEIYLTPQIIKLVLAS